MMMKKNLFLFLFLLLNISFLYPQKEQQGNLKTHISVLTSDSMQGRRPGLDGDKMAAEYIRKEFQKIRVSLLGEEGFSYFEVVTSVKAGAKNQFMYMEKNYEVGVDYTPITFSRNDALHANIYFAGYGFD
ncbi:MAG: hypothetical protein PHI36_08310, partial [Bacteroidales bacterium]|nr:hypothetical protein [Bacteroidales bacterium]